jgi:hypothetical protein
MPAEVIRRRVRLALWVLAILLGLILAVTEQARSLG